ncbi:MAG: hypothetical protein U9R42_10750, partial [Bacteroidota bacterium]|nr:hypothetical protein [Bacteroidota bacterium]
MIKNIIKHYLIFTGIFFIVQISPVYGQLEAKHWYFGTWQGLRFENNSPVKIYDSKMSSQVGSSCISDKYGNLLFYSDGKTIWNKNHDTLKNGFDLIGSSGCAQAPIIIPYPGDTNLYYLFTVMGSYTWLQHQEGLWYHILDISKDNGNGEIILKNRKLCSDVQEKIAATMHANKQSVWIITSDWNSNKFKAFLITKTGLDTIPVISSSGSYFWSKTGDEGGQFKFSPSGKKLANALSFHGIVDILDFDNKTGRVSNCITLDSFPNLYLGDRTYGIEFSHNEKFLYITKNSYPGSIFQVNLSSRIESIIKNSIYIVYSNPYTNRYASLQIGLNKKIYLNRVSHLGCINEPDNKGNLCNYIDTAITFSYSVGNGLPTFLQSYFYLPDIEIENTCLGDSTAFSLKDTSNIDSVYWYFGDSNYSWQFYPKHVYSDTGFYITNAVIFYDNTNDTFE